jgi:hypothetical protein
MSGRYRICETRASDLQSWFVREGHAFAKRKVAVAGDGFAKKSWRGTGVTFANWAGALGAELSRGAGVGLRAELSGLWVLVRGETD